MRLHLGVGLDRLRRPFLEDAAVVHDGHALDHAQRDVEIMLDDDVADVERQRPQDRDQFAAVGGREPGRRLVEQHEARRARERHADLELALLAVAQLRHVLVRHGVEMRHMRQLPCRFERGVVGGGPYQAVAPARHAAGREIEVVEDAEALEQQGNLIGAPQAAANALVRRKGA